MRTFKYILLASFVSFLISAVFGRGGAFHSISETLRVGGDYYFNGGEYNLAKAKIYYMTSAIFDIRNPAPHYQLARVYFVEENFLAAYKRINRVVALQPHFAKAYYTRGLIRGFTNQLDGAEADFEKALEIENRFEDRGKRPDKGKWAIYNDLAWIHFRKGNYHAMKKTAEGGVLLYPDNIWLLNSLGLAFLSVGDKKEAAEILRKANETAKHIAVDDVQRAYPGNAPASVAAKRSSILTSIKYNLSLALEQ